MHPLLGTLLKWFARFLAVAAIYVLVCSLFLPSGVQALNGVVCDPGQQLDNARLPIGATRDDAPLEISCVSRAVAYDASRPVALTVAGLVVAGFGVLYLRQRLVRQRFRRPEVHAHGS